MKRVHVKVTIKKKAMAILMALVFMFSDMSCIVFASETEQWNFELDDVSGVENTDELNAILAERGRIIRTRRLDNRGFVLTNIIRLLQNDSRWGSTVIGKDDDGKDITMGSSGCAITSFAIISNWLSNTSITPADVKERMGAAACPFEWSTAATLYGYSLDIKGWNNSGIDDGEDIILGAIDLLEKPVLVGIKNSSTTHFVVAYGYNSSYDVIISDPAQRNYTLLSQYLNDGYAIHRIFVYR